MLDRRIEATLATAASLPALPYRDVISLSEETANSNNETSNRRRLRAVFFGQTLQEEFFGRGPVLSSTMTKFFDDIVRFVKLEGYSCHGGQKRGRRKFLLHRTHFFSRPLSVRAP